MKWFFSTNKGGRDSGFNDSGIETFKGNFFRYLARELIQNSLDARHDRNKPVVVRFDVEDLPPSELPDSKSLATVMQRCKEYWPTDKKAQKFFAAAEAMLSKKPVPCLRIGDYNTTGVRGSDSAREKEWYNLIRCSGSSSKGAGEGGSFGIGKNAPFAASDLRTVLYSTKNTDGECAFQGVANLVTHLHANGALAQSVGYLGATDGASVRKESDIPKQFARTKLGTDIWLLGFHHVKDWKGELVFSVLDNFWPAIHFRDLEVFVGNQKISSDNLASLLAAHAGKEDFSAHQYYRAFTAHTHHFDRELPTLAHVDLYLLVGDLDLPKRVAMVRSSGMVIEPRLFRSPLPFCGVFLCKSERGNKILREMEPPRHDEWDPDHPEKGANKKTEAEFISFIRECVRALTPADDAKSFAIPGLGKFLPDDDETVDESFDGDGEAAGNQETANRRPKPQKLEGKKIDPRRRQSPPESDKPTPTDDTPTPPTPKPPSPPRPPLPTPVPDDVQPKPPIAVLYRTFARNPLAGVYAAIVTPRAKGSATAMIRISEIGDDGAKISANIKYARTEDGSELKVAGNCVGPVALIAGKPLKLELVLSSPARVSMGVDAHEA